MYNIFTMKIISVITNNETFIDLQLKSFQKYIHVPYEFIVFNDGKDFPDSTNNNIPIKSTIRNKCALLNIRCIYLENEHHRERTSCSDRHNDSLQVVVDFMKNNKDEYLIIDGDMFLIDNLNIEEYRKYHCACVLQHRDITYMWPNLLYIDMRKIDNIDKLRLGCGDGGDTGADSHEWLMKQQTQLPDTKTIRYSNEQFTSERFYFIKHLWSLTWNKNELPSNLTSHTNLLEYLEADERNENGNYFCEIYDKCFFHYRAGTWFMLNKPELHKKQIEKLHSLL